MNGYSLGRKPRLERVRIGDVVGVQVRGRDIVALVVEPYPETRELLVRPARGQGLPRGLAEVKVPWRTVHGWRSSQLDLFNAPVQAGGAIHGG